MNKQILLTKNVSVRPPYKLLNPLSYIGSTTLITEKTNRFFTFELFLTLQG